MNIESSELNFLNQLTTEIIILDKDYKIIWLNDSALNKGWYINSKIEDNHISKQLSEETASSVMNLLNKSTEKRSSQTKRDFPLITVSYTHLRAHET